MTFTVATSVDQWIDREASIRLPDGHFHPSSLFECERKAIYEIRGTEPSNEKDARNKRILHLGTTWHQVVQRAIASDPRIKRIYIEVPAEDDWFNITGHADAVAEYEDGSWELFEIKTAGLFQWKKYAFGDKKRGIPPGPSETYRGQARTYAYCLRRNGFSTDDPDWPSIEPNPGVVYPPLGDALLRIRFIFVCRDDLTIAEFVENVDPAWETNELEPKMLRLQRYQDDGTALPPRLPLENGERNWLCAGYCTFRDRCFNLDKEGVMLDEQVLHAA